HAVVMHPGRCGVPDRTSGKALHREGLELRDEDGVRRDLDFALLESERETVNESRLRCIRRDEWSNRKVGAPKLLDERFPDAVRLNHDELGSESLRESLEPASLDDVLDAVEAVDRDDLALVGHNREHGEIPRAPPIDADSVLVERLRL